MSEEVLQRGALREIRRDKGTLILAKYPRFTIDLLISGSSRFLAQSFDQFARTFDAQFQTLLKNFSGDVMAFAQTVTMVEVEKIFEYIPRYVDSG